MAKSKALVKWDARLAEAAKKVSKGEELPQGKFISLKGGRLSFGGADIPDNEMRAIIIGAVHEHQYYDPDVDYDADNPSSPICFAFGEEEGEMKPHEASPKAQHESCEGCPNNEWGSSDRGKGKACKEVRRLALIAESDLDDLDNADIVYMKVPVTSVRNFSRYVSKDLGDVLHRPYWAVLTTIKVIPDKKSQFKVQFELHEKVETDKLLEKLEKKYEEAMKTIGFPYIAREREEAPRGKKTKQKGGARGKATPARKFAVR
jgi:hypothetical protein